MTKFMAIAALILLAACSTPPTQPDGQPASMGAGSSQDVEWPRSVEVVAEPPTAQILDIATGERLGVGTAVIVCSDADYRRDLEIVAPGYELNAITVDAASPDQVIVRLRMRSSAVEDAEDAAEEENWAGEEDEDEYREDFGVE